MARVRLCHHFSYLGKSVGGSRSTLSICRRTSPAIDLRGADRLSSTSPPLTPAHRCPRTARAGQARASRADEAEGAGAYSRKAVNSRSTSRRRCSKHCRKRDAAASSMNWPPSPTHARRRASARRSARHRRAEATSPRSRRLRGCCGRRCARWRARGSSSICRPRPLRARVPCIRLAARR